MAFVKRTANGFGRFTETKDLPASSIAYSTEIDFLKVKKNKSIGVEKTITQYVTVQAIATAVAGTNIDIDLYGSFTKGGTKFLLRSNLVTALTNASKSQGAVIDLQAYPCAYYYVAWTVDADNSANDITINISGETQ